MPLSATSIRNAKPQSKPYKLYDAGGLFLIVTPAGGKWWRLKCRFEGKEKLLSLGTYPKTGLKDAREKRDEAKKLVVNGIDPSLQRQAVRAGIISKKENTFEAVAREWFEKHINNLASSYSKKFVHFLSVKYFPPLAARALPRRNRLIFSKLPGTLRKAAR